MSSRKDGISLTEVLVGLVLLLMLLVPLISNLTGSRRAQMKSEAHALATSLLAFLAEEARAKTPQGLLPLPLTRATEIPELQELARTIVSGPELDAAWKDMRLSRTVRPSDDGSHIVLEARWKEGAHEGRLTLPLDIP